MVRILVADDDKHEWLWGWFSSDRVRAWHWRRHTIKQIIEWQSGHFLGHNVRGRVDRLCVAIDDIWNWRLIAALATAFKYELHVSRMEGAHDMKSLH